MLATIGAIVAEYLSGGAGLGYLAVSNLNQLKVDSLFGVIVLLSLMGLLLHGVMAGLRRWLVSWHPSAADRIAAVRMSTTLRTKRLDLHRDRRRRDGAARPHGRVPHRPQAVVGRRRRRGRAEPRVARPLPLRHHPLRGEPVALLRRVPRAGTCSGTIRRSCARSRPCSRSRRSRSSTCSGAGSTTRAPARSRASCSRSTDSCSSGRNRSAATRWRCSS